MVAAEEYFGDWAQVIDSKVTISALLQVKAIHSDDLCPSWKNIFKAFKLCPYNKCRAVFVGQDPYPQQGVAQGILFGNSIDTPEDQLSPSLQVVKEAVIDYTIPHGRIEFDNTLESWCKQGILMINSALTCKVNQVGSHYNIWHPFISTLFRNLSLNNSGLIWVLFGNQASSYKQYILGSQNILEVYHPAYYARRQEKMPNVFAKVNEILRGQNGDQFKFYKEYEY